MKLIFLDINGVLVHTKTLGRRRGHERMWQWLAQLDVDCVKRLCNALERTGAKIVVTSDWRRWNEQYSAIGKALYMHGGRRSDVLGRTAYLPKAGPGAQRRSAEISEWLEEEDVETYVVLDDDYIPDHPLVWVRDGMATGGLQDEHVEHIVQMLGEKQA